MTSLDGDLSNLQVLVTGASGFLGQRIVNNLLLKGVHVIGIDRRGPGSFKVPSQKMILIEADLPEGLPRIRESLHPSKRKSLVHLAGIVSVEACEKNPGLAHQTNVDLTMEIARFAQEQGFQLFIFPSTGLVYGDSHKTSVTEEIVPSPKTVYAKTKLEAERRVEEATRNGDGLSAIALRLGNIYGAGMNEGTVMGLVVSQLRTGSTLSLMNLSPMRDFIHVDDVVDAILRLLQTETTGYRCFNLSTGIGTRIGELARLACEVKGLPESSIHERLTPDEKKRLSPSCLVLNNQAIRQFSGWRPRVSLRDGLSRLLGKEAFH